MVGRGTRNYENKKDCLILDFVGVNNSVQTLNVLDVLDGTILSDREKTRAQKLVDEGESATDALETAKLDIAKLEAMEIKWKALSKSNPFDIMKLFAVPSRKGLYGGAKASFIQRGLLDTKGIKCPAALEKGEAELLLNELRRRSFTGLASFKQLQTVKKFYNDFDPQSLTRAEADEMIQSAYSKNGLSHLVTKFKAKCNNNYARREY